MGVFSLVLLEVALRILGTLAIDGDRYVADERLGFRVRSGLSHAGRTTNSRGFNDDEWDLRSRRRRVAVIGDSFVFGAVPREKNFVVRTEELLYQTGVDVDVVNLGIPAAGPRAYLELLRGEARELGVELAVVVLFVGNDISQSHPDFRTRLLLGTPRSVLESPWQVRLDADSWYVAKSLRAAARMVEQSWRARRDRRGARERILERISAGNLEIFARDPSRKLSESFEGLRALLRRMHEEASALGIDLVFVVAPDRLQVDASLRERVLALSGAPSGDYSWDLPQERIATMVDAETIDLLPPLLRAARSGPVYRPGDTHWNSRGNRGVAHELAPLLRGRLGPGRDQEGAPAAGLTGPFIAPLSQ